MRTRSFIIAGTLLFAATGCRDDAYAPVEPIAPALEVAAAGALSFRQVTTGGYHTCGLTGDGKAYCWGDNYDGRLGNGINTGPDSCPFPAPWEPTACSTRPVAVLGGLSFRQLAAGGYHTCGVTASGKAYCWGDNSTGQLGDGTTNVSFSPVAVAGGLTFRALYGGGSHTCGVTTDGKAYCWGWNASGQLGNGTRKGPEICPAYTNPCSTRPVAVLGNHVFRQLAAGSSHTCGVAPDGVAYCWGSNFNGELGDSTYPRLRLRPVLVSGTRLYRQLEGGESHTCGVTPADRAFCWGRGADGQLGNGKTYLSFWPRRVAGDVSFASVAAGLRYSCGLATDGRGYCWGANYNGQLGDGTTTDALTPVAVTGGLLFNQLAAGDVHACGKTSAAALYCWGWNAIGQLGDGTTTDRPVPAAVVGPL